MRKQTKIAAIVSAATLLAIGASMTSFAVWEETEEGSDEWAYYTRYREIDMSEGWHRGNAEWTLGSEYWYFADENGIMKRDELFEFEDSFYYVHPDGHRATNEWIGVEASDDVEMSDERVSFDTVWYYFGSTGRAVQAKSGDYEAVTLPKDNGVTDTGIFVFDENGVMQIGYVKNVGDEDADKFDYYCAQKYDSSIIQLASGKKWNFVTGQALTGWAYMDTETIIDEAAMIEHYREEYGDQEWFYFNKGRLVKSKKNELIGDAYYSFDENGVMIHENKSGSYKYGTASNAMSGEADGSAYADVDADNGRIQEEFVYYFNDDGAMTNGNQWANYSGDNWYYIVNLRDADSRELFGKTRGVIFNAVPDVVDKKNGQTTANNPSRMISDGGKYYMIGADGKMITSAYKVTKADVTAWFVDDYGADKKIDGRAKWNGISYVVPTYDCDTDGDGKADKKQVVGFDAGNNCVIDNEDIYFYFDDSTDHDGDRGERIVGRVTYYEDDDDIETTRFFTANGMTDPLAIYGDYLYEDGLLYTSQDGDRYELVPIEGTLYRYPLKSNVPNVNEKKPIKPKKNYEDSSYLIVDYLGRVQKGYTRSPKTVTLDDGNKYEVQDYVAIPQP